MKYFKILYKLIKLLNNKVWRKGILKNIAANIELEDLVKNLKFNTVIDIGSNKGQFIMLIDGLYADKHVFSFEPIKEILEKQKDFFINRKKIYFFNHALGENNLKKIFYLTKRRDSSSFLKVNKSKKNRDYLISEERLILTKTFDEVFSDIKLVEPILMKIDVQGYELSVLKGCKKSLKKIKYIITEVSDKKLYEGQPLWNEIFEFLKQNNFILKKENSESIIKNYNIIQKDILFINRSFND